MRRWANILPPLPTAGSSPSPRGWFRALTPAARRRAALEATLDGALLTYDESELIRGVVGRAKLWPRECADVAAELVAHFEDARDAGLSPDAIMEAFGSAQTTAALICRAKRRQRSLMWRVARRTAIATATLAATTAALYITSATSFYLHNPAATIKAPATTAQASAKRVENRWQLAAPDYQAYRDKAELMLAGASEAGLTGDAQALARHVKAAMSVSATLRAEREVAADLAAARIEDRAAGAVIEAIRANRVSPGDPALRCVDGVFRRPARLEGARAAFAGLLDEMYAVDGRLTSAGVDMMRVFKKWHEPSLTDRLMDPVWFAFPASRAAVQSRFEGLVELAERAGTPSGSRFPVTETIRPLSASMMTCLRFPALSVVLPQLTEVLVAHERAARSRSELVDLVRPSAHCVP